MFHRLKQIKGGDGTGRPVIGNNDIIFNGDASKGDDHETFRLSKDFEGFQFCKTARKSYDRYVKAVLIVAQRVAPGALEVSCDGDDEPDCYSEGKRIADAYMSQSVINGFPEVAKQDAKGDELEEAIELWVKLSGQNKVHAFLANYLKANLDDLKEAYQEA